MSKRSIDISHDEESKSFPLGYRDVTEEFTQFPCDIVNQHGEKVKLPEVVDGNYLKQSGAAFYGGLDGTFLDGLAGIVGFHINGIGNKAYFSNAILDQKVARDYISSKGKKQHWKWHYQK
jgi:hypothetical protein